MGLVLSLPYITTFAIEPDVPHDPLAPAASAEWARARHLAVLGLPLDARAEAVLGALEQLDLWLQDPEGLHRPRSKGRTEERFVVMPITDQPDEALPSDESPSDELPSDELPSDELPSAEAATIVEEAIELSADEVSDAGEDSQPAAPIAPKPRFAAPQQFATAETIVLSGPEIKRKIRHKQSIMPSYVAQILYEDIGALFEIGDREGALISLERLLALSPITPQIDAFLAHNELRLLEYYQTVLGPWTRTARLREGETAMPRGYFALEKVAAIVRHLDGTLPLQDVIARSGLRNIEACAVLSQLARSSSLDLGDKA